jgi:hypothetical protein
MFSALSPDAELQSVLMQAPQVILLKEGTDTSQGKPQLISNINACTAVADVVRTTLGPRGMDKLVHDDKVRIGQYSGATQRSDMRSHLGDETERDHQVMFGAAGQSNHQQ